MRLNSTAWLGSSLGAVLAVWLVVQAARAAGTTSHLPRGISAYGQARYLDALPDFLAAVKDNYNDATAHYYLANCLANLGQRGESLQEYKIAYCLARPHSQLAEYCLQALRADQNGQQSRQAVARMVSQIREQVTEKGTMIGQEGQLRASDNMRTGQLVAASINESASRYIAFLQANPAIYYTGGGHYILVPRTAEIAEARARAQHDSFLALEAARRSAEDAAAFAARQRLAIEESAANLERQFLQPSLSGVRLNPVGTNLYVRNFSEDGPASSPASGGDAERPQPLVAKAKKLDLKPGVLAQARTGSWGGPSGARATAGRGGGPGERATGSALAPAAGRGLINTETRDVTTGLYGKVIRR